MLPPSPGDRFTGGAVEAWYLNVEAEVRYWEDGTINGQPDNDDATLEVNMIALGMS
ncbi:hypothetical protein [Rhodobacter sp. 24-YEA-8]|uniref:hypothetical protein n=1 Tax=Rhodobacter sp. 24-YEA-8 TaxID=1884310 RepID=UPI000894C798|nr:hypothetical protein [Rhodobacter sp. 24-YEA-8]SEB96689.1 hypothetical protein SAMN05519105_1677 [Rhodobacter sp. 24-YEA-8]